MARVRIEWSAAALADLDRFAEFLADQHPRLAAIVASAILERVELVAQFPELGRPDQARSEYRQIVLRVLNASYLFQYRYDGERVIMLRVFHGREDRSGSGGGEKEED